MSQYSSLHNNVSFGTTTKCVDYAGVLIFKCPDYTCDVHIMLACIKNYFHDYCVNLLTRIVL